MNNSVFITAGGYPLKSERLEELEETFTPFNSFGSLAGNLSIISGCESSGTTPVTVANGFVYIDGELYEFRGGYATPESTVIIVEEERQKAFKNGQINTVYIVRYATFGVSENSWLWSEFKRPANTVNITERLLAIEKKVAVFQAGGGMVLWNKPANQIPDGWQEVVNWRGRIPVGLDTTQAEFNTIGKTGGAKNKTLSIAEMPAHSHDVTVHGSDDGNGWGRIQGGSPEQTGTNSVDVQSKGGGQQFSLLNPYRVVLFIEYVG